MATNIQDLLGAGSVIGSDNNHYIIKINRNTANTIAGASVGGAGNFQKIIAAMLIILYKLTSEDDIQNDPDYRIVGSSVFQGKTTVGDTEPEVFDTYDMSFSIRVPSPGGELPDPDDL